MTAIPVKHYWRGTTLTNRSVDFTVSSTLLRDMIQEIKDHGGQLKIKPAGVDVSPGELQHHTVKKAEFWLSEEGRRKIEIITEVGIKFVAEDKRVVNKHDQPA